MTNIKEDGEIATNNVGGIAGTGDSRLPADQKEPPGKKRKLRQIIRRKPM